MLLDDIKNHWYKKIIFQNFEFATCHDIIHILEKNFFVHLQSFFSKIPCSFSEFVPIPFVLNNFSLTKNSLN